MMVIWGNLIFCSEECRQDYHNYNGEYKEKSKDTLRKINDLYEWIISSGLETPYEVVNNIPMNKWLPCEYCGDLCLFDDEVI